MLSEPDSAHDPTMEGSYRSTRACPACAAVLTELSTVQAVVDRCPDCGGIWIEWFDGEISSVASGARHAPAAGRAERVGEHACPDCRTPLQQVRYPDEKSGVEILRCGVCAGAFVPRGALDVIAVLGPASDAPASARSWLDAVVERVRSLLGA